MYGNKISKSKKGFTLIELIVVIAIIAILAAILIPTLLGFVNNAKETACEANMREAERLFVPAFLLKDQEPDQQDVAEFLKEKLSIETGSDGAHYKGGCPSHGEWNCKVVNGYLIINCSKHAQTTPDLVGNYLEELVNTPLFQEYMTNKAIGTALDSQGENFGLKIKDSLAQQLGINSEDFDFRAYKTASNQWRIYLTDPLKTKGELVGAKRYIWDPTKNNGQGAMVYGPEEGKGEVQESNGYLVFDAFNGFSSALKNDLFVEGITQQEKEDYNRVK